MSENQPPSCQVSTYVMHSVSYRLSVSENQALSSQMSAYVLQIVSSEQSVNENQPVKRKPSWLIRLFLLCAN